jgi:hypothetical protein
MFLEAIPFGRTPRRSWECDGLPCMTLVNHVGHLNGYVRLPETHPDLLKAHHAELTGKRSTFAFSDGHTMTSSPRGYDHIDVQVHGDWTYGPDVLGWIGFDTGHSFDYWPEESRREMIEPRYRDQLEYLLEFEHRMRAITGDRYAAYETVWTEQMVEQELERVARELAARARQVIETGGKPRT